jgi:hypothetical protein
MMRVFGRMSSCRAVTDVVRGQGSVGWAMAGSVIGWIARPTRRRSCAFQGLHTSTSSSPLSCIIVFPNVSHGSMLRPSWWRLWLALHNCDTHLSFSTGGCKCPCISRAKSRDYGESGSESTNHPEVKKRRCVSEQSVQRNACPVKCRE